MTTDPQHQTSTAAPSPAGTPSAGPVSAARPARPVRTGSRLCGKTGDLPDGSGTVTCAKSVHSSPWHRAGDISWKTVYGTPKGHAST